MSRIRPLLVVLAATVAAAGCAADTGDGIAPRTPYDQRCATCHGPNGAGLGDIPAIDDYAATHGTDALEAVIVAGTGRMPGVELSDAELAAIVDQLTR